MNVITIEEEAFYILIEKVVSRIGQRKADTGDRWIDGNEAMNKLRIKSKTTLQKYRNEGKIRFSQPEKKHILYDTESINEFISKSAKETF